MSSRALYFVEDEIFFHCQQTMFSESCLDSLSSTWPFNLGDRLVNYFTAAKSRKMTLATMYVNVMEEYTQKALTYQSDAMNAVKGIGRTMSEIMRSDLFMGIPACAFDLFILFTSQQQPSLRRRPGFPSYSWSGWAGGVRFLEVFEKDDQLIANWFKQSTWIVWYKRSTSQRPSLVWDPSSRQRMPIPGPEFGYGGRRQRFPFRRQCNWHEQCETAASETLPRSIKLPEYAILQFWTATCFYAITESNPLTGGARLMGSDGQPCGYLFMDGLEDSVFFQSNPVCEFALLSLVGSWDWNRISDRWEFGRDDNACHVMCLEWNHGVAERRGLGVISLSSLDRTLGPGPQWKEILLA